jgi:hypothetical protein
MALEVILEDHTGNLRQRVRLSETSPIEQLIKAIITTFKFPVTDTLDRPVVYHLRHNWDYLREDETLFDAEVQPGDTLVLVPATIIDDAEYFGHILLYDEEPSTLSIRIVEKPLTAKNLTTIFTSLTSLYVKCVLIARFQPDALIDYIQTHNDRFALQEHFVITEITHNSPFTFDINMNIESVAKALQVAIDSVSLAGLRKREMELSLQAKELDMKLMEQEAQSKQESNEHLHQREIQEAELERQRNLLEIEKQLLALELHRFEFHTMRIEYTLKTAAEMVSLLHLDMDENYKTMIVQTLLPDLLQLGSSKGLQLALPLLQEEPTPKDS